MCDRGAHARPRGAATARPHTGSVRQPAIFVTGGWHTARTGAAAMSACGLPSRSRVLVVDDDDRIRTVAALLLERAGHDVLTASTPREAMALLDSAAGVRVVVTDIVMPEMTGYDFAREVRRAHPLVRFVYMSGYANDQFREPVDDPYVVKPFATGALVAAVAAALR
jgi:two-component system, cell cycle sensor histidine kinase and response regulator CckA